VSSLSTRDGIVHAFDPGPLVGATRDVSLRTDGDYRISLRFDAYSFTQQRSLPPAVSVNGLYKPVSRKVRPMDSSESTGLAPGGLDNWKEVLEEREGVGVPGVGRFSQWLIPKFSHIIPGSRLTKDRKKALKIGPGLTYEERELLFAMLDNREGALAWDFSYLGLLKPEVSPLLEIRTVPHEAWQEPSFSVPRALVSVVNQLVRERLDAGIFERCDGPYRNPYFLVGKKETSKYRMVQAALRANKVTIRDANLPPSADEFSEHFAGCAIASLVDCFSSYDQLPLAEKCRDMTGFMTSYGLLRHTRILQGATNSVAQFVRIMCHILRDLMPSVCMAYLDDVRVRGPSTTYDNAEDLPGIRRFVREHIQSLDQVLASLERAGLTMSGPKSQWCMNGVQIVGYICSFEGRLPETAKIIKILEWPPPRDVTQARAFIGVYVYYRIWIEGFAEIAVPIYELFQKN
jgi:hypothetical protein